MRFLNIHHLKFLTGLSTVLILQELYIKNFSSTIYLSIMDIKVFLRKKFYSRVLLKDIFLFFSLHEEPQINQFKYSILFPIRSIIPCVFLSL
jgi:hypothetical protein